MWPNSHNFMILVFRMGHLIKNVSKFKNDFFIFSICDTCTTYQVISKNTNKKIEN